MLEHPVINPAVHQIEQWEPYHKESGTDKKQALEALLQHLNKHGLSQIQVSTRIFIVPGYEFRMIDGMLTNFHQPQSTLLLLVSAFIGSDWEKVYQHALGNNYRFLSYGDSNLYLRTP
jgi:S-adenosylmethionine:tRNA ribosyltransferase-isomerase